MSTTSLKPHQHPLTSAWSALDSQQLVQAEFFHRDPETLDLLLDQMPDTEEVPEIEFAYDTTLHAGVGQVRCRHCKKNAANHNRGFVLRYMDGSRVLIGRDCGEKQFGERFTDRRKDFSTALKRASLLKRRQHIVAHRRDALVIIEQIEGYEGWKQYGKTKRSYRDGLWFAVADLVLAVDRRGGLLTRTDEVRDYAAEERRTHGTRPVFKEVEVKIGTLAGGSFFSATGPLPEKLIPDLAQRLKSTIFNIHEVERDHDLEVAFRGIDKLLGDIEACGATVAELWRAADPQNLDLLGRWMEGHRLGHFRREGQRLYRYDAAGNVVSTQRGEHRVPAQFLAEVPSSPVPAQAFSELRRMMKPE